MTSSRFTPGTTTSVPGGDAKRWLTPGPTPPGWNPPGPQCSATTFKGTTSLFVQINGVERSSLVQEDYASSYDPVNGGGPHSLTGDATVNLFDPSLVANYSSSCNSPRDPTCTAEIHAEIDHDWKAAGYCGPGTACDDKALASQTIARSTLIDVQGFVYWDPDHVSESGHQFSGWEIHPLTAWRLSSPAPQGPVGITWSPVNPQVGDIVNFTATAANATSAAVYDWDFGDGVAASGQNVSHIFLDSNAFQVQVIMSDAQRTDMAQGLATIGSWNPQVSCGPVKTSIEGIVGNVTIQRIPSITGSVGADYSGGGFLADGRLPYGSNPTSWPFFKRDLQPPCATAGNVSFIELHNVTVIDVNVADCSTAYAADNGGAAYPNSSQNCDTTFNLVTPGFGDDSTCPACYLHRIYAGIDRDWNASGTAPLPAPVEGERVDVQGFVYWNNNFINASWHSYSGWEMHPIAAWRPASPEMTAGISPTSSGSIAGQSVTFNGTASGGTAPYTMAWDFGDGTMATGNAISHVYDPGVYSIHMAATDAVGNVATSLASIRIDGQPSFSLSASRLSLNLEPGKMDNSIITAEGTDGFLGTVSIIPTVFPLGPHLDLDPPMANLAPNGKAHAILSVSAPPNIPSGQYIVSISGLGAGFERRIHLLLDIAGPSFALSPSLGRLVLLAGTAVKSQVTVASFEGFSSNVNLALSTLPPGVHATFGPAQVALGAGATTSSFMTLSTSANTPAGNYALTLTGTNGPITRRAPIILTITSSYNIGSNPASLTLVAGTSRSLTINLRSLGFKGSVALSVSTSDPGLNALINPGSLSFNPGESHGAQLKISSRIAGNYTATVTASSGSQRRAVAIPVTVNDLSISPSRASLSLSPGSSTNSTITLTSLNGFTGNVNLAVAASPGGLKFVLSNPTLLLTPQGVEFSTLQISTGAATLPGIYTMILRATAAGVSRTATILVTVIT